MATERGYRTARREDGSFGVVRSYQKRVTHPPGTYTVFDLRQMLGVENDRMLRIIRDAGIELTHLELHYTDDRPRNAVPGRRRWRPLTEAEAAKCIALCREQQGARLAKRAAKKAENPAGAGGIPIGLDKPPKGV